MFYFQTVLSLHSSVLSKILCLKSLTSAYSLHRHVLNLRICMIYEKKNDVFMHSHSVRRECTKLLCEQLQSDDRIISPPVKETFDFKLTLFKKEIRLNIKVSLEGEKCDVLLVKKDEIKLLIFDVLALNRFVICSVS